MVLEDHERHHHRPKKRRHSYGKDVERKRKLPFDAHELTKDDMDEFRRVFTLYLKEKKDIHIDEISSTETYARFKSFVRKWLP